MKKPIIFVLDDDPQVLQAVIRDMRSEYRKSYRIISTTSAQEGLEALRELKLKNEVVALFLSDQRMPEMLGVTFLEKARAYFPEARRVLLTAYSDIDAAIKAINDVQLDYYLLKPWDPPQEKLFPVISDLLNQWQAIYRPVFEGVKVLGYQWSPRSHQIKDFLAGNLIPYMWNDIESDPEAVALAETAGVSGKDMPVMIFEDGSFLKNPEIGELATKIGLQPSASAKIYDVVIVGAGPAGLAAAVYGASEGLNTLLVERRAPGGQAGTSSRIENYLGFPTGVSGSELAHRAITQARRLGAEFLSPQSVKNITLKDGYKILTMGDGAEIHSKSVILTTGVDYRQLEIKGLQKFTGAGVYYGAATTEANACKNGDVYVVGGGNSAGQAAMYLSKFARSVKIVIRRDSLTYSMSQYLIEQIGKTENIELMPFTEIIDASGENNLERVELKNAKDNKQWSADAKAVFIFIGAKPYTEWLNDLVITNPRGFVETGRELENEEGFKASWKLDRQPLPLETNIPGIFAAGDVRAGAMNRVASAVGEGSMSIKLVHEYLATL